MMYTLQIDKQTADAYFIDQQAADVYFTNRSTSS